MDNTAGTGRRSTTLRRMTTDGATIEVPLEQVRALAGTLRAQGDEAAGVAGRLTGGAAGGVLRAAVEAFLDCQRAAARALAGELHWLGSTVAGVADAWARLDAEMLPSAARGGPR